MMAAPRSVDLVFGASGYIGSNLVPFLLAEGRFVRATSRNIDVLNGRGWSGAEIIAADALDPTTLDDALRGVCNAYYLVHSMAAGNHFPELDAQAAQNFAEAAARHGVCRIVYLGDLVPEKPQSTHLRSRLETGEILRSGAVPVTEIRAGMIIGPGSAAWEVIRGLVPRVNLTRFDGVFAPNSKYRARVTPAKRARGGQPATPVDAEEPTPAERRAAMTWAQRLKRVFGIDIETCPACGAAMASLVQKTGGRGRGVSARPSFGRIRGRAADLHADGRADVASRRQMPGPIRRD